MKRHRYMLQSLQKLRRRQGLADRGPETVKAEAEEKTDMRHEVIPLPCTGAELELYLTDNRAVEPERRRPLILIFPGGAYAYRSDREAEPVALRLHALQLRPHGLGHGLHAVVAVDEGAVDVEEQGRHA